MCASCSKHIHDFLILCCDGFVPVDFAHIFLVVEYFSDIRTIAIETVEATLTNMDK